MIVFPVGCKEADSKGVIKLVTVEEFKELEGLRDVQLIDIRTLEEYNSGYIEGYQNMDYLSDTFKVEMETLDKSKPIVIYCRSGGRSGRCATLMLEIGFKEIYDLLKKFKITSKIKRVNEMTGIIINLLNKMQI